MICNRESGTMKLKQVRTLIYVLLAVMVLLILVGAALDNMAVMLLGFGFYVVWAAVELKFWRCPHCGKSLWREGIGQYCRHCGRKLDPEDLV